MVAGHLPGRTARQCRDRWRNYFQGSAPEVPWTADENVIFWSAINLHGPRWSIIQPMLKHRSRSDLRRHWIFGTSQLQKRPELKQAPRMDVMQYEFPSELTIGLDNQSSRREADFGTMVWDEKTEFWFEITAEACREFD
jgi:hypothetical protein